MPKVLIDIPEEIAKEAMENPNYYPIYYFSEIWQCLSHGTLLPEDFSLEDYERYKKDSENLSWIRCPEKMGN